MGSLLQSYLPLVVFIGIASVIGLALLIAPFMLAYSNPDELRKWAGLLGRSSKPEDGVWDLDEKQRFRLVKGQVSQVKGVRAIVFKVRSLEKAVRYLKARNAYGRRVGDLVQLDQAKSNGLTIFFSGD